MTSHQERFSIPHILPQQIPQNRITQIYKQLQNASILRPSFTSVYGFMIIQIPPSAPGFGLEMFTFQGLFFYFPLSFRICYHTLSFPPAFPPTRKYVSTNKGSPANSDQASVYKSKLLMYSCCLLADSSFITESG